MPAPQELEKKQQTLKMAELEKQDLQKERDTLESSCNYFQTKYKSTQNELRALQREQPSAQDTRAQRPAARQINFPWSQLWWSGGSEEQGGPNSATEPRLLRWLGAGMAN